MSSTADMHVVTKEGASKKAVVLGSLGWSLVNFRLDLIRRLAANGYEVLAAAADIDDETAQTLRDNGVRPCPIPMDRTGTNPVRDLGTLWALVRFFRREKPDLVISYTMKPNIYGSLAAQIAGVPASLCAVHRSGLQLHGRKPHRATQARAGFVDPSAPGRPSPHPRRVLL